MIATVIQILTLVIFLMYIDFKFGNLSSISESTYRFPRHSRYWFTVTLWIIGLANFFQPLDMYSAVAGALLCFTGVTISFKSEGAHTDKVHYLSALGAIVLCFVGLWALHDFWIPSVGAVIMMIPVLIYSNRRIYWIEIIAFFWIMMSYLAIHLQ